MSSTHRQQACHAVPRLRSPGCNAYLPGVGSRQTRRRRDIGSEPKEPWGPEDDQRKPFTPQERRNEDVEWTVHDMPDEDRNVNKADPEHDDE